MAFPTGWGRKQKITIQSSKVVGSGSHSNLPVLVTLDMLDTEIVDAGSNSALNGGGDLRFSSDSAGASQLACEVVEFVTNASAGSRKCEVWVKVPSVSTSTNTDIYIWYKKAGESQPAVTDTYGRNAVWSDCEFVTHDFATDSTGNHTITTAGSGGSDTTSPWGGYARDFNDGEGRSIDVTGIDISGDFNVTFWGRVNGSDTYSRVFYIETSDGHIQVNLETDFAAAAYALASTTGNGGAPAICRDGGSSGNWEKVFAEVDSLTTSRTLRIGTTNYADSDSGWSSAGEDNYMGLGYRTDASNWFNGDMANVIVRLSRPGSDWADTEYNNQADPSTFATAGTPGAASGGSGATIPVFNQHYRNQGMM